MPLLHWLTRDEDIHQSTRAPYRLLEEEPELSHGDRDTGNMLIQGDNLDALKALLPYYAGKVKCIFIDPPYNTHSAFEHYDDNLEHAKWLSMMYPRLELLRDLLSEDGSIWVTIDDNEAHYLKVIIDEIFGRRNFVQTSSWFKRVSPANDAKYFSTDSDFVFCIAKNINNFILKKLQREEKHNKGFSNPDNDPRGMWSSGTLTGNKTPAERPNLYYAIRNPKTGEDIFPPNGLTWRYGREKMEELFSNNVIYWGKNGASISPRVKRFLAEAGDVVPRSVWLYEDVGHTQEAMLEQKNMFSNPFGTPKPERLLKRVIDLSTNSNDLVLDSFLGSGTTTAVAHKMGRRYIGIEMGEHAKTHCAPRLKKVIQGEQGGISEAVGWKGGGGFRFYRLGVPVFDETGHISEGIKFAPLAAHIWFIETGVPLSEHMNSPFLGSHEGTGYYLLYNGILGDKRPNGGNVLTSKILDALPPFDGPKLIFGEGCRLSAQRLNHARITFRQIPYDIKAR